MTSRRAKGEVRGRASDGQGSRGERERAPWAGNPPQVDAARERLLDAAARCIAREGLAATTIASVAAEAGVSRPTVYRYFDDRDALVRECLRVAAARLRDTVLDRVAELASPADMVVEAVVLAVHEIPADEVLHAIWNSAALDASVVESFTEPAAVAWVRECLEPVVDAAGWSAREADEVVEVVLRMVLSLLITPAPRRSPAALRAFLRRRLLPGLGL
jgi:AcrR family transcriptional regulator